jgi:hypothetical protein
MSRSPACWIGDSAGWPRCVRTGTRRSATGCTGFPHDKTITDTLIQGIRDARSGLRNAAVPLPAPVTG